MTWAAILAGAAGCYLLKLAGLSVPQRVLDRPLVRRTADVIPVALLAALVAVQGWRPPWCCSCCAHPSSWWSSAPRSQLRCSGSPDPAIRLRARAGEAPLDRRRIAGRSTPAVSRR
jgi:hypothetical protein